MNVIYLDSLFALSLLTDYLLCLVTARLCALRLRRGRYLLAALFGALYAAAVFLPHLGFLAAPVFQLGAAAIMGLIAFGGEARLLRCLGAFLAVSAAFGGAVWAIALRRGTAAPPDGRWLLGCFLGCYLALTLIARTRRGRADRRIVRVELALGPARAVFSALVDTGNCLTDPATGARVLIASPRALAPLLGSEAGLLAIEDPVALVTAADAVPALKGRMRLIACSSLGGGALLPLLRPDSAAVDGKAQPGLLAAVSGAVRGEGFEAIL